MNLQKRANGKWRARYTDPETGKQRARHFERKKDGERFLTGIRHSILVGDYVDPAGAKVTFEDYAKRWQSIQSHHRPSTRAQLETNLKRHILPTFGPRRIGSIRPSDVQAWVSTLATTLQPGTVELIYRYASAIFKAAVKDRLLTRSPCDGTKLPRIENAPVTPPTTEEVQALIAAVPERYRALLILSAGTGMRQGECFGLTVDRIDFLKRRSIRVDRQLLLAADNSVSLAPPKTPSSSRTIPMPNVVQEALAAHLAAYERGTAGEVTGLVFTNDNGEPIRRNRFSETWVRARKRADATPSLTFHDLRHYYASLLIHHGESVKVVQSRLGHKSATETLDTYAHLWPDSDEGTREAVDVTLSMSACSTAVC